MMLHPPSEATQLAQRAVIKVKRDDHATSDRTSAEWCCLVAGDAGPVVTRDEDQPDLLKNEASFQDAIFGVSRHCLCPCYALAV